MDSKKTRTVWGATDPGILRKKDLETELFVFGYSCKVFRDDAKALEMDQGKQLIPWMGNDALKIDRYDARGHFSELSQFEATNQDYVLTIEERKIEQLCDEERYHALYHNEEEQEMYQEEELKRLKQALGSDKEYNQVSYNYTDTSPNSTTQQPPGPQEEEDDPFVPSPLLDLPEDMVLPSTAKQNEIIEKTAKACAVHGAQMDIVIKTRQANNPKFNFMYVNSTLYPYYIFLLNQFKSGRYRPTYDTKVDLENNEDNDEHEHYLHPSLASSMSVEPAPSIPSIAYRPNPDNAYSKLISKIKAVQQLNLEAAQSTPSPTVDKSPSASSVVFGDSVVSAASEEMYSVIPRRKRRKKSSNRMKNGLEPNVRMFLQTIRHVVAIVCLDKQMFGTLHTMEQYDYKLKAHEPPEHVKQIIMKLIITSINKGKHPYKLGAKLNSMGVECVKEFALPFTKYFKYYENVLNMEPYSQQLLFMKQNEIENELPESSAASPTYSENFQFSDGEESGLSDIIEELHEPLMDLYMPQSHSSTSKASTSRETSKVKPSPVCFSIKKPREAEKLEYVSALPVEESSSEGEGEEQKEPVQKIIEEGKIAPTTKDEDIKKEKTRRASPSPRAKEKNKSKGSEDLVNGATAVNGVANSSRSSRSSGKSQYDKRASSKHKKSRHKSTKKSSNPSENNSSCHTSKEPSKSRGYKKTAPSGKGYFRKCPTIRDQKKRAEDRRVESKKLSEKKRKSNEKSTHEDDDDVVKDSLLILEQNIAINSSNSTTTNDADEQRKQRERKMKVQRLLSAVKNNLTNPDKSNTPPQDSQLVPQPTTGSGSGTVTPFDEYDEPPPKKVKSNEDDFRKKVKSSLQGYLALISKSTTPESEVPPTSLPPPSPSLQVPPAPSGSPTPPPPLKPPEVKLTDSSKLVLPEPKTAPGLEVARPEEDDDVIFVSERRKAPVPQEPVMIQIDVDSDSESSAPSTLIPLSTSNLHKRTIAYKKKHSKKRKRKHSSHKKHRLRHHSSSESSTYSTGDETSSSSSSSDSDSESNVKSKKKRSEKKKQKTHHRSSKSKKSHRKKHRSYRSPSSSEEDTSSNLSSNAESEGSRKHKKKRSHRKKHSKSKKATRSIDAVLHKKHHSYKSKSHHRDHSSSE